MVSFWPFKGDDSSTASFEKTLSSLTEKISSRNVKRDALRSSGRRYKALWTLYSSFIYTIYAMIILLISGRSNWGSTEYSAFAGGPIMIYLVRAAISRFYEYRISSMQAYLEDLNQQKEAAIEKFKEATKYNTTQQLLEKYGAAPPSSPKSAKKDQEQKKTRSPESSQRIHTPARTNHPIPPTANIQRNDAVSSKQTPDKEMLQEVKKRTDVQNGNARQAEIQDLAGVQPSPTGEFAPNAYPAAPQYSETAHDRWYDRLMDVILGEDETRAANRLVLICASCRLVNGQAPPGVKTLEEVGRWKCASCKAWNGVTNETEAIIKDATREAAKATEAEVKASNQTSNDKNEGDTN